MVLKSVDSDQERHFQADEERLTLSIQEVFHRNDVASFVSIDGGVVEDILRWLAHDLLGAIFVSERSNQVIDVGILL